MLKDHYDIKGLVDKCKELHKPDVKKLEEFELSSDFDHLPDDRSIKCYMHCLLLESGFMKPQSQIIDPSVFIDVLNLMEVSEQNTYLKMFKKCNRKNKDLCEMVYQINVCMKRNDNEHFYLFYDDTWV